VSIDAHDERQALRDRIAGLFALGDASGLLDLVESQFQTVCEQRDAIVKQSNEIARLRRLLYGRRSEKLSSEELGQLVMAYGASPSEAAVTDPTLPVPPCEDAPPEEEPRPDEGKGKKKPKIRRPNHRGRTQLSPALERIVTPVPVPLEERSCKCCGAEMKVFDHAEHERLEFIPAKFVVHVERREKLACQVCHRDATTAPRACTPDLPLRVGASVLAYLVESKCDDALPIHRQCDQFARMGFELPESTAYGYWRYITSLLLPIADALLGTVLEDPICVGVDDTTIKVLDPSRKGGTFRGHLWCFRGSTGLVAYQFTETWKAEEIAPWFRLIGPETHVQVDDYKGYGSLVANADGSLEPLVSPERRLGCMMHVRRRFHEAFILGDRRAGPPLKLIKELYKIEEQARGRSPTERLAIRQEHSMPLLDEFDRWVDEHDGKLGKSVKLAKAAAYAKNQRVYVRRCFEDGRFEIDNGAVERTIREVAIGRKNYLFTGSVDAAKRLAAAYTIVQTCRNLGISTSEYLIDVITRLERKWPARRLTELLPHRWLALREAEPLAAAQPTTMP